MLELKLLIGLGGIAAVIAWPAFFLHFLDDGYAWWKALLFGLADSIILMGGAVILVEGVTLAVRLVFLWAAS